jgi:predicted ribosome-associated RNA-binding protein Tma20
VTLLSSSEEVLFFQHYDGPFYPLLRVLHKCVYLRDERPSSAFCSSLSRGMLDPMLLPTERVDRGAIKFVLSGADIMCPGLTNKGAEMTPAEKDTPVVRSLPEKKRNSLKTHTRSLWSPSSLLPTRPQAVMAEGKEHALALGCTIMSTQQMYVLLLFGCLCVRYF